MTEKKPTKKSVKFFMTLDDAVYDKLAKLASKRGITLQQYIRAVILPEWISKQSKRYSVKNNPK